MTLDELAAMPGAMVSSQVAADFLGLKSGYSLVVAAKKGMLTAPHCFIGTRLKISKAWLLDFCGYNGGADQVAAGQENVANGGRVLWLDQYRPLD